MAIVTESRAAVETAETTELVAPISGTIDARPANIGDEIEPDETILVVVAHPAIRVLALELEAATLALTADPSTDPPPDRAALQDRVDLARQAVADAGLDPDEALPGRPIVIRSPVSGVVFDLAGRVDDEVVAGQVVARIGTGGEFVLRLPETVDGIDDVLLGFDDGTVVPARTEPAGADGRLTIWLGPDAPVEFGDRVTLQLIGEQATNVVRVPTLALRRIDTATFLIVEEDGVRRRVDIQAGLDDGSFVEIAAMVGPDGTTSDPDRLIGTVVVAP